MTYLVAFGYVFTEDGYFSINSEEYKELTKEENNANPSLFDIYDE
tara:strand:- start:201 stop:335 length:135 start_codon:yes stop_codon:yes gene_type:complete